MDTTSELVPYRSKSLSHRLVVETSLIAACHTIDGNKASSSTRDINILAPMILQGASIDWRVIAEAQPTKLNPEVIPRHCRRYFHQRGTHPGFFSSQDEMHTTEINVPPDLHGLPEVSDFQPGSSDLSHRYNLRSLEST